MGKRRVDRKMEWRILGVDLRMARAPWSVRSPTRWWRGFRDGVYVVNINFLPFRLNWLWSNTDTDFLKHWGTIERTRLFDETWVASSYWLSVRGLRIDRAWSYGDVSCKYWYYVPYRIISYNFVWYVGTFTIPEATPAVIVLQQVDNRYFRQHCGWIVFHFDFVLFKKGSKQPLARPVRTDSLGRSVILEIQLEPGEYVVHARIDRNNFREKVRTCHYRTTPKAHLDTGLVQRPCGEMGQEKGVATEGWKSFGVFCRIQSVSLIMLVASVTDRLSPLDFRPEYVSRPWKFCS